MERVNPFYCSMRQQLDLIRPPVLKVVPISVNTKLSCAQIQNWFQPLDNEFVSGGDNPERLEELLALLQRLVIKSSPQRVNDFLFNRIQGMTSSRHQFNNWQELPTALDFGMTLQKGGPAKFSTQADFEKAKNHVFKGSGGELTIRVLGWHDNRVIWAQDGRSHHGAAMLRYLHEQGKTFHCPARITTFELNRWAVREIEEFASDHYMLIMKDPGYRISYGLRGHKLGLKTINIQLPTDATEQFSLFVFPKRQKGIPKIGLSQWVNTLIQERRALSFCEFLSDPRMYE